MNELHALAHRETLIPGKSLARLIQDRNRPLSHDKCKSTNVNEIVMDGSKKKTTTILVLISLRRRRQKQGVLVIKRG